VGSGFLGPLGGGAIANNHHRANEFIALLREVVKRQFRIISIWQHHRASVRVG
jgi:hypothetical protein